jgi:hypothetical protein
MSDLAKRLEAAALKEESYLDSTELTLRSHGKGFDRQNGQTTVDLLREAATLAAIERETISRMQYDSMEKHAIDLQDRLDASEQWGKNIKRETIERASFVVSSYCKNWSKTEREEIVAAIKALSPPSASATETVLLIGDEAIEAQYRHEKAMLAGLRAASATVAGTRGATPSTEGDALLNSGMTSAHQNVSATEQASETDTTQDGE